MIAMLEPVTRRPTLPLRLWSTLHIALAVALAAAVVPAWGQDPTAAVATDPTMALLSSLGPWGIAAGLIWRALDKVGAVVAVADKGVERVGDLVDELGTWRRDIREGRIRVQHTVAKDARVQLVAPEAGPEQPQVTSDVVFPSQG